MNTPTTSTTWRLLRSLALALLIPGTASFAQEREDGIIDLLFLGHGQREGSGYHLSHLYAPLLNRSLGQEMIRMSYTEDPSVLNDAALEDVDVLLIYANHQTMDPQQEAALLRFVDQGGGFMPIHSASACFGNSDAYVDLVGARFHSHGMETFTTRIAPGKENHPILDGYEGFETRDETYVHSDHNEEAREVLMLRQDEPWTWTRQRGEGRVFYTAYGHDETTWGQNAFHDLLVRGILWSVGDEKRNANRALVAQLPEKAYQPKDTIPNYRRITPVPQLQNAFSPDESMRLSLVDPAFELRLFAAEPNIVNPIALAWDERGRLFVAESVDYPHEMQEDHIGNDRITICEDTDGDGQADRFTVFAEGMNIPTGLTPVDGGWIVAQAPHFLFLKDTDGDDRADVRYPINSSWGTRDTHAGPSNLRYGHDNKIWGAVGYSAVQTESQGEFEQGIFRMNPDGSSIEPVGQFNNNTWGLGISEDFEIFGSTANNAPAWHIPIWRRFTYGVSEDLLPRMAAKIDSFPQFFPITDKFLQVDAFGRYTAGAGFNLYTARAFPEQYWNAAAFIGGPTGHLLGQFFLEEDGASYHAHNRGSIVASLDEWFSPVYADVGPDGQLWVADWYNFIIQHNPTPTKESAGFDAKTGGGNAHVNPLRDREKGRIYRIVARDPQSEYQPLDLHDATTEKLIEALGHDNMFWRLTAQRKLVREQRRESIPQLQTLVLEDQSVDKLGLNVRVIHALWTLHGLNAFNLDTKESERAVRSALEHPSAAVRKNAVMALSEGSGADELSAAGQLMSDADAKVRLKALLAVSASPPSEEIGARLFAFRAEFPSQPWLSQAFAFAALRHGEGYLKAMLSDPEPASADILSQYERPEDSPEYILSKRFLTEEGREFESLLNEWAELPAPRLVPMGLALLDVWRNLVHAPSEGELAALQKIVLKIDAQNQMVFKLKAAGLPLNFPKVEEEAYAAYHAENAFEPDIWTWGPPNRGEPLYQQYCVGCHGPEAKGDQALGAPALAGLDAWYAQVQLQKFHAGLRGTHFKDADGIAMRGALSFLDAEQEPKRQISYLAHYLETLPKSEHPATIEGDAERGKILFAACLVCHGDEGEGNQELGAPGLTGQADWYLASQLKKFQSGLRGADPRDTRGQEMALLSKTLPDEKAINDVVAYIRSLGIE